ncbi:hypothetical protein PAPYR_740 [Paratrimastix pyriformis]|uniref:Sfi1 spindle body domain-containing protein n=1 Tax=Paratrimastix pyriformis TaxID=342808 RepID=A0ABQ8UW81_9EUKA|nr:hypothetical protein PAPYR_740 [Paratrimastix pyriformis]
MAGGFSAPLSDEDEAVITEILELGEQLARQNDAPLSLKYILIAYEQVLVRYGIPYTQDNHIYRFLNKLDLIPETNWWKKFERECERRRNLAKALYHWQCTLTARMFVGWRQWARVHRHRRQLSLSVSQASSAPPTPLSMAFPPLAATGVQQGQGSLATATATSTGMLASVSGVPSLRASAPASPFLLSGVQPSPQQPLPTSTAFAASPAPGSLSRLGALRATVPQSAVSSRPPIPPAPSPIPLGPSPFGSFHATTIHHPLPPPPLRIPPPAAPGAAPPRGGPGYSVFSPSGSATSQAAEGTFLRADGRLDRTRTTTEHQRLLVPELVTPRAPAEPAARLAISMPLAPVQTAGVPVGRAPLDRPPNSHRSVSWEDARGEPEVLPAPLPATVPGAPILAWTEQAPPAAVAATKGGSDLEEDEADEVAALKASAATTRYMEFRRMARAFRGWRENVAQRVAGRALLRKAEANWARALQRYSTSLQRRVLAAWRAEALPALQEETAAMLDRACAAASTALMRHAFRSLWAAVVATRKRRQLRDRAAQHRRAHTLRWAIRSWGCWPRAPEAPGAAMGTVVMNPAGGVGAVLPELLPAPRVAVPQQGQSQERPGRPSIPAHRYLVAPSTVWASRMPFTATPAPGRTVSFGGLGGEATPPAATPLSTPFTLRAPRMIAVPTPFRPPPGPDEALDQQQQPQQQQPAGPFPTPSRLVALPPRLGCLALVRHGALMPPSAAASPYPRPGSRHAMALFLPPQSRPQVTHMALARLGEALAAYQQLAATAAPAQRHQVALGARSPFLAAGGASTSAMSADEAESCAGVPWAYPPLLVHPHTGLVRLLHAPVARLLGCRPSRCLHRSAEQQRRKQQQRLRGTLAHWVAAARFRVRLAQRTATATEGLRRQRVAAALAAWRALARQSATDRQELRLGVAHHQRTMAARCWRAWRLYAALHKRRARMGALAMALWRHNATRRAVEGWHAHAAHMAALRERARGYVPSRRLGLLSQAWDTWLAVFRATMQGRGALEKAVRTAPFPVPAPARAPLHGSPTGRKKRGGLTALDAYPVGHRSTARWWGQLLHWRSRMLRQALGAWLGYTDMRRRRRQDKATADSQAASVLCHRVVLGWHRRAREKRLTRVATARAAKHRRAVALTRALADWRLWAARHHHMRGSPKNSRLQSHIVMTWVGTVAEGLARAWERHFLLRNPLQTWHLWARWHRDLALRGGRAGVLHRRYCLRGALGQWGALVATRRQQMNRAQAPAPLSVATLRIGMQAHHARALQRRQLATLRRVAGRLHRLHALEAAAQQTVQRRRAIFALRACWGRWRGRKASRALLRDRLATAATRFRIHRLRAALGRWRLFVQLRHRRAGQLRDAQALTRGHAMAQAFRAWVRFSARRRQLAASQEAIAAAHRQALAKAALARWRGALGALHKARYQMALFHVGCHFARWRRFATRARLARAATQTATRQRLGRLWGAWRAALLWRRDAQRKVADYQRARQVRLVASAFGAFRANVARHRAATEVVRGHRTALAAGQLGRTFDHWRQAAQRLRSLGRREETLRRQRTVWITHQTVARWHALVLARRQLRALATRHQADLRGRTLGHTFGMWRALALRYHRLRTAFEAVQAARQGRVLRLCLARWAFVAARGAKARRFAAAHMTRRVGAPLLACLRERVLLRRLGRQQMAAREQRMLVAVWRQWRHARVLETDRDRVLDALVGQLGGVQRVRLAGRSFQAWRGRVLRRHHNRDAVAAATQRRVLRVLAMWRGFVVAQKSRRLECRQQLAAREVAVQRTVFTRWQRLTRLRARVVQLEQRRQLRLCLRLWQEAAARMGRVRHFHAACLQRLIAKSFRWWHDVAATKAQVMHRTSFTFLAGRRLGRTRGIFEGWLRCTRQRQRAARIRQRHYGGLLRQGWDLWAQYTALRRTRRLQALALWMLLRPAADAPPPLPLPPPPTPSGAPVDGQPLVTPGRPASPALVPAPRTMRSLMRSGLLGPSPFPSPPLAVAPAPLAGPPTPALMAALTPGGSRPLPVALRPAVRLWGIRALLLMNPAPATGALVRAFAAWRAYATRRAYLRGAIEARLQRMATRLGRETLGRWQYRARKQASGRLGANFMRLKLLGRVVRLWGRWAHGRHSIAERIAALQRAIARRIVTADWAKWKAYTAREGRRKGIIAEVRGRHGRKLQTKAFHYWLRYAVATRMKSRLDAAAGQLQRHHLTVRAYWAWRHAYALAAQQRALEQEARLHLDAVKLAWAFRPWRARTVGQRSLRQRAAAFAERQHQERLGLLFVDWVTKARASAARGQAVLSRVGPLCAKHAMARAWGAWHHWAHKRRLLARKSSMVHLARRSHRAGSVLRAWRTARRMRITMRRRKAGPALRAWASFTAKQNLLRANEARFVQAARRVTLAAAFRAWGAARATFEKRTRLVQAIVHTSGERLQSMAFQAWRQWAHQKLLRARAGRELTARRAAWLSARALACWRQWASRTQSLNTRALAQQATSQRAIQGRVFQQWRAALHRRGEEREALMRRCMEGWRATAARRKAIRQLVALFQGHFYRNLAMAVFLRWGAWAVQSREKDTRRRQAALFQRAHLRARFLRAWRAAAAARHAYRITTDELQARHRRRLVGSCLKGWVQARQRALAAQTVVDQTRRSAAKRSRTKAAAMRRWLRQARLQRALRMAARRHTELRATCRAVQDQLARRHQAATERICIRALRWWAWKQRQNALAGTHLMRAYARGLLGRWVAFTVAARLKRSREQLAAAMRQRHQAALVRAVWGNLRSWAATSHARTARAQQVRSPLPPPFPPSAFPPPSRHPRHAHAHAHLATTGRPPLLVPSGPQADGIRLGRQQAYQRLVLIRWAAWAAARKRRQQRGRQAAALGARRQEGRMRVLLADWRRWAVYHHQKRRYQAAAQETCKRFAHRTAARSLRAWHQLTAARMRTRARLVSGCWKTWRQYAAQRKQKRAVLARAAETLNAAQLRRAFEGWHTHITQAVQSRRAQLREHTLAMAMQTCASRRRSRVLHLCMTAWTERTRRKLATRQAIERLRRRQRLTRALRGWHQARSVGLRQGAAPAPQLGLPRPPAVLSSSRGPSPRLVAVSDPRAVHRGRRQQKDLAAARARRARLGRCLRGWAAAARKSAIHQAASAALGDARRREALAKCWRGWAAALGRVRAGRQVEEAHRRRTLAAVVQGWRAVLRTRRGLQQLGATAGRCWDQAWVRACWAGWRRRVAQKSPPCRNNDQLPLTPAVAASCADPGGAHRPASGPVRLRPGAIALRQWGQLAAIRRRRAAVGLAIEAGRLAAVRKRVALERMGIAFRSYRLGAWSQRALKRRIWGPLVAFVRSLHAVKLWMRATQAAHALKMLRAWRAQAEHAQALRRLGPQFAAAHRGRTLVGPLFRSWRASALRAQQQHGAQVTLYQIALRRRQLRRTWAAWRAWGQARKGRQGAAARLAGAHGRRIMRAAWRGWAQWKAHRVHTRQQTGAASALYLRHLLRSAFVRWVATARAERWSTLTGPGAPGPRPFGRLSSLGGRPASPSPLARSSAALGGASPGPANTSAAATDSSTSTVEQTPPARGPRPLRSPPPPPPSGGLSTRPPAPPALGPPDLAGTVRALPDGLAARPVSPAQPSPIPTPPQAPGTPPRSPPLPRLSPHQRAAPGAVPASPAESVVAKRHHITIHSPAPAPGPEATQSAAPKAAPGGQDDTKPAVWWKSSVREGIPLRPPPAAAPPGTPAGLVGPATVASLQSLVTPVLAALAPASPGGAPGQQPTTAFIASPVVLVTGGQPGQVLPMPLPLPPGTPTTPAGAAAGMASLLGAQHDPAAGGAPQQPPPSAVFAPRGLLATPAATPTGRPGGMALDATQLSALSTSLTGLGNTTTTTTTRHHHRHHHRGPPPPGVTPLHHHSSSVARRSPGRGLTLDELSMSTPASGSIHTATPAAANGTGSVEPRLVSPARRPLPPLPEASSLRPTVGLPTSTRAPPPVPPLTGAFSGLRQSSSPGQTGTVSPLHMFSALLSSRGTTPAAGTQ